MNEGIIYEGDVLTHKGRIEQIGRNINPKGYAFEVDAEGMFLLPGVIDDQVHFREPGLTHKGSIYSESKAAIAGGTTSFMEMPNTKPSAVTHSRLAEKYSLASIKSLANYSFFMGAGEGNLEEIKAINPKEVCGVKIFMGSSTGDLVIDDETALEDIFRYSPTLIATHCESDDIIRRNAEHYKNKFGNGVPMSHHPDIRSAENCIVSSKKAIELAKKHSSRLHILHISTADETHLFESGHDLSKKQITAEVCVHHLWFTADDYEMLGGMIKCNPAIKEKNHREQLLEALKQGKLDIIATDHAPHTFEEKTALTADGEPDYFAIPAGLPLVQHGLNMMYELHLQGHFSLEFLVEKMCHKPADCFRIVERGYVREGYYADLILFDPNATWKVDKSNIQYHCGWSPLEGVQFKGRVRDVFVNGNHVFSNGAFDESVNGLRLYFDR